MAKNIGTLVLKFLLHFWKIEKILRIILDQLLHLIYIFGLKIYFELYLL